MSYAVISVGGKQYRVSEGQRLLVDRLRLEDGATFSPGVLLVGGNGETQIAPDGVTVTARVVGHERGPKIRIGKYRRRTGYRRHTGFRSALTQIEIESIGGGAAPRRTRSAKAAPEAPEEGAVAVAEAPPEAAGTGEGAEAAPKKPRARKPKAAAEPPGETGETTSGEAEA